MADTTLPDPAESDVAQLLEDLHRLAGLAKVTAEELLETIEALSAQHMTSPPPVPDEQ